jgi:hypothetical protein
MKTIPQVVWHQLPAGEVLRLLEVDLRAGLTDDEVRRRREKFGLFHTAPLDAASWLRIAVVAAVVFAVVELEKWLRFGRSRGDTARAE